MCTDQPAPAEAWKHRKEKNLWASATDTGTRVPRSGLPAPARPFRSSGPCLACLPILPIFPSIPTYSACQTR